jgi:hypothetical protein
VRGCPTYKCSGETASSKDDGSNYSGDALIYFEGALLGTIAVTEVF